MMKIQITADGSHTLFSEMAGQTYHSSHGAIQESQYIFISQLSTFDSQLSILEIGFGTGLNAVLAAKWARENRTQINYTTIELYPLEKKFYTLLNYGQLLGCEELFLQLHDVEWDAGIQKINDAFAIRKCKCDIVEWLRYNAQSLNLLDSSCLAIESQFSIPDSQYDVVFFDAFSPDAQPELWTEEVFLNVYRLMKKGGVMTTYCAKGDVRRAMLAAGFKVEKLQGPPGKRHILRAKKE